MAIDEKRRAQLRKRASRGIAERSALAALALKNMTAATDIVEVIDHARISLRRSPGSSMGPNLIIKLDGTEIGRYLLEPRILDVPRWCRPSVEGLLRSRGEVPRRSLPSLPLPTAVTCRFEVSRDLIRFTVPASVFARDDAEDPSAREIGLLRLQSRIGVAIAEEFHDLMRHRAAELGFPVDQFVSPSDLPGPFATTDVESLEWRPKALRPSSRVHQDDYELAPALVAYLADQEAKLEATRRARLIPLPQVQSDVAAKLPPLVAAAIEEAWELRRSGGDVARGREWSLEAAAHGNCLTSEQVEKLKDLTPTIPLPLGFSETHNSVKRDSPSQAPFRLALELRDAHPDWWEALPWSDLNDVSRNGAGPASTFKHVTHGVIEESGQAEFIRLVSHMGSSWPVVHWPTDLGLNDQMRAWLAVSALAQADLFDVDLGLIQRRCALCGLDFHLGTHRFNIVVFTQTEELCWPCGLAAAYGMPGSWTSAREAAMPHALKSLAEEVGTAPSLALLQLSIADGVTDRILACALRSVLPAKGQHSTGNWMQWLQAAGVLEGGWRASRGIISIANDGHHCRSMFERHVDDFFSQNHIPHQCEPTWPYHATHNPTGLRRADWLLPGGVHVEAAGMMSRGDYAAKMSAKVALAEELGIEIIVIQPSDVVRLDEVFSKWL
ncbi:hypothetical protein [Nocardioides jejuensis]|uniref:Uncharacterized protein n=1 Tax=Nocardioides jejuensis TaxID=2502782 RepID=A0A4R1CJJ9_9ACTN|nr:hypothetical protein [Nocardioides jejuensis]TCJ31047.1 hypothetical protein EPD65_00270 [Nocardioides jejuensis]